MAIDSHHLDSDTKELYTLRMWECKRCKERHIGAPNYLGDLPERDGWYRWQTPQQRILSNEVGYDFWSYMCPACALSKPPGITEVPHFHIPRTDEQ